MKTKKFTLVEMLVVMIIMVILMGMMLPSLIRMFGTSGIDGSAMKLQAVLLNTRALAAKHNAEYAVVFNSGSWSGPSFVHSREWEDCWYAVVGLEGDFQGWSESNKDNDFDFCMVGGMKKLGEGVGFLSLTHNDGFSSVWGAPYIVVPDPQPDDPYKTKKLHNDYFDATGFPKYNKASNGWVGEIRITYRPDGSCTYYPEPLADGTYQWITISGDGTTDDPKYYENRIALRINRLTGLVQIKPARLTEQ